MVRSFKIVDLVNKDGCKSKFNVSGRYTAPASGGPADAARKAFNEHCRVKDIKGQCTFYVTIVETTQGSNDKKRSYMFKRMKLDEPETVNFNGKPVTYEYKSVGNPVDKVPVKCSSKKVKSSGRMRRKTAKKSKSKSKSTPKKNNA